MSRQERELQKFYQERNYIVILDDLWNAINKTVVGRLHCYGF